MAVVEGRQGTRARGAASRVRAAVRRWRGGAVAVPAGPGPRGTGENGQAGGAQGEERLFRLLHDSPLFDEEWYALRTGATGDRAELVRHYLATPVKRRTSPQPLFDPEWFRASVRLDLEGKDPFVVYLRRRAFGAPTHPAFSTVHYRRTVKGAKKHPHGPLGHYLEVGAAAGVPGNRFLPLDDEGRAVDLRAWLVERHRALADQAAREALPRVSRRALRRELPAPATIDVPVDVVLTPGGRAEHLRTTLFSLVAQTHRRWHVLVQDDETSPEVHDVVAEVLPATSWTRVDVSDRSAAAVLEAALAQGEGTYVAFLAAGETWAPDRLARLVEAAEREGSDAVADVMRVVKADGEAYHSRAGIRPATPTRRSGITSARLLLRRSAVDEVGLDTTLPAGWEFALLARLAARGGVPLVPAVGPTRDLTAWREARWIPGPMRPVFDQREVAAWADVVLNDLLVDWEAEARKTRDPDVVSVVVPTHADWQLTSVAVERVLEHGAPEGKRLQVVVVDNGNRPEDAVMLDLLALRFPEVQVEHRVANLNYALGNNVAVPQLRGATVVFLNNDTEVQPGWLEPLLTALDDDAVLGAQPLLLYPDGTVQCAGIAFPSTGGLAHGLLVGFPAEDARGVEALRFHAVTGACLVMRTDDVVALRGFDPVFSNGMEDVDLCLRAAERRPGHFTVRPEAVVVHHESKAPGRHLHHRVNRQVFLDRWGKRLPKDDVDLWATRGFRVTGHAVSRFGQRDRHVAIPEPVLQREPLRVVEGLPALRWAIKNPAPFGEAGEKWGDTHFARSLAEALRELGQQVVVDRRDAFERPTGRHDDVNLVLRGLAPFWPTPENVTLGWVISHPEMLLSAEAAAYDRVLVASYTWAEQQSKRWGFPVEPLLQATDHRLFRPDRAVPDTGHPVLFVGSARQQYRPIVRKAVEQGLPLSVYGTEWEDLLPRRFLKGTYVPNDELAVAYRSAGVVLNDHWEDMRRDGFVSNRLFDAVASGARVLSDDVAGLSELFGRSVQVVETPQDLVRLSSLADPDAVFGDDEERRAVADRVRREHSFAARARRLVEVAVEARRERGFR